jgi:N-acyl-D-amino-acid deacylase
MKRFFYISFLSVLLLAMVVPALAADYDLVILNGRVMEPETNFDGIRNVGIKGGKIAVITKNKIKGKETINATGLVVAPGFIDTHLHALDPFATKLALRDGVTTGMDLEMGALNIGAWYAKRAKEGWQVNYGTTQSFDLCRALVTDPEIKNDPSVDVKGPIDYASAAALMKAARKDGKPGYAGTRSTIAQMNEIMKCVGGACQAGRHLRILARLWLPLRRCALQLARGQCLGEKSGPGRENR